MNTTIDLDPTAYPGISQEHEYDYDTGLMYLPIASDTPERPARIRFHAGFGRRDVRWKAVRKNSPPVIPVAKIDNDDDSDTARPFDRCESSRTTVHLPIPDPSNGTFTYAAEGVISYVQSGPDGPRVPGVDALPSAGFPFYLGRIDDIAGESLVGYSDGSGTGRPSQKLGTFLEQKIELTSGFVPWPTTLYSPYFTNTNLIQE